MLVQGEKELKSETSLATDNIVGSYVCVKEEGKVWVAYVDSFDEEFEDFLFTFYTHLGYKKCIGFHMMSMNNVSKLMNKFWVFFLFPN